MDGVGGEWNKEERGNREEQEMGKLKKERETVGRERRDKRKGMDVSNGVMLGGSEEEKRGQVILCLKK